MTAASLEPGTWPVLQLEATPQFPPLALTQVTVPARSGMTLAMKNERRSPILLKTAFWFISK